MLVLTLKWNKRTAVFMIAAAAVLLVALVLFVGGSGRKASAPAAGARLDSTEKRVAYLASLGWSVDPASETEQQILIPKEFGAVYEKYNEPSSGRASTCANTEAWTRRSTPTG